MENINIRRTYAKMPILGCRQFRKAPKGIEVSNINHTFTNEDVGKYRVLTIEDITFRGRLNKINSKSIEFENLQVITDRDSTDLEKMIIKHRGGKYNEL